MFEEGKHIIFGIIVLQWTYGHLALLILPRKDRHELHEVHPTGGKGGGT